MVVRGGRVDTADEAGDSVGSCRGSGEIGLVGVAGPPLGAW